MRKNGLVVNLKKCCFHKDKVCFLGYVVLAQGVWMKKEKIDVVKNWIEPKSVHNIQVFLSFANFYHCFIQGFNRIATPLTSMLKMSLTPISATQKLLNLVDKFGGSDYGENKARRGFTSTKRPTGADYPFSDHISHAVSNFVSNYAKNVSNYLTPNAKRAFDQLY